MANKSYDTPTTPDPPEKIFLISVTTQPGLKKELTLGKLWVLGGQKMTPRGLLATSLPTWKTPVQICDGWFFLICDGSLWSERVLLDVWWFCVIYTGSFCSELVLFSPWWFFLIWVVFFFFIRAESFWSVWSELVLFLAELVLWISAGSFRSELTLF